MSRVVGEYFQADDDVEAFIFIECLSKDGDDFGIKKRMDCWKMRNVPDTCLQQTTCVPSFRRGVEDTERIGLERNTRSLVFVGSSGKVLPTLLQDFSLPASNGKLNAAVQDPPRPLEGQCTKSTIFRNALEFLGTPAGRPNDALENVLLASCDDDIFSSLLHILLDIAPLTMTCVFPL